MAAPISVVTALYNKRESIRAQVESVLGQSYADFEMVVVDDGSTDGSAGLVEGFGDSRIRLIRQENRGRSAARNRAIAEARGELVALLDADDVWAPGFLAAIVELRSAYPEAGLYATGVGRCYGGRREDLVVSVAGEQPRLVKDYLDAVSQGDFITASNIAVPAEVFRRLGGFDPRHMFGEDREVWAKIALEYDFACDPRVLAWYFTPTAREESYGDNLRSEEVPPAVEMLRAQVAGGRLAAQKRRQAEYYVDWALVQQCEGLLWMGAVEELGRFVRSAPFISARERTYCRLMYEAARVLPVRAVAALLWPPARRHRAKRRLAERATVLESRTVACGHGAAAD